MDTLCPRALALGASGTGDPTQDPKNPFLYNSVVKTTNESYHVGYFLWSPMTTVAKFELAGDRPPAFSYKRANFNNQLKVGLIDDCLSDAVAYLGKPGDKIRAEAKAAICEQLDGRLNGSGACDVDPAAETVPTVLISESLGSKIMIDAIRDIWRSTTSPARRARLAAQVGSITQVFLVSNQVPLLDIARAGAVTTRGSMPHGNSDFVDLARIVAEAKTRSSHSFAYAGPLKMVSFDDPNDLLSYRLRASDIGLEQASLVNVIVSNDVTYLDFLERPDTAHCGYAWNANVVGMLVNGYNSRNGITRVPTRPAKQSCL
jgi:hypothetical protein